MGKIEYYDYKWSVRPSGNPRNCVVRYTQRYLKRGMRVLDFGCGNGRHLKFLADNGVKVVGYDISRAAVDICNKLVPYSATLNPINLGSFDAILCNRAIENNHTDEINKIFDIFGKVLRSGGTIFLTTRSTYQKIKDSPLESEKLIKENEYGGKDYEVTAVGVANGVEQHYFTEKELDALFGAAGIEVINKKLRDAGDGDYEWQYTGRKK